MMILHQVQTESRQTGDTSELSRWANLIQPHTTEAGRMIQACKKYTRTAEYATIKMVENLDESYIHAEEDSKKLKDISDQNKQKSKEANKQDKEAKEAENMRKRLLAEAEKLRKVLEDGADTEGNAEGSTEAKDHRGKAEGHKGKPEHDPKADAAARQACNGVQGSGEDPGRRTERASEAAGGCQPSKPEKRKCGTGSGYAGPSAKEQPGAGPPQSAAQSAYAGLCGKAQ
jgi:hypothetical protein